MASPAANRINYQKELERQLALFEGKAPSLLLHSCCGPCSSYVLEYLSQKMRITVYYDNPNIHPAEEYEKRLAEQKRLLAELPVRYPVRLRTGDYDPERYYQAVRGLEAQPEGGERCRICYALRMRETALLARAEGFDYFSTTLSVSPYKNARWVNEIGGRLSAELGVAYLYGDFKKKNGYQRSIQLSREYGLYRQEYCGCSFSLEAKDRKEGSE